MADVKKMATREGYGRALVALGAAHEDVVVLDADLAGATKTGMFARRRIPTVTSTAALRKRNMMCVAAGLRGQRLGSLRVFLCHVRRRAGL